ncbi:23S rRNA (adenine(2030)-N(6))-methyltransferase RlmJ [Glaciecola siphonariae]|uniref:Ribosomal RNA large subunit methyltransferase J n=1 Tax=Glaciecola siphonariae TaxID=521012 RepID=A0ABV9LUE6_9ALTE
MLSYQHAFHAGNHADVLKHITLIACLQRLNKKQKPYFALDTHAGTGLYALEKTSSKRDAFAFEALLTGLYNNDAVSANEQINNEALRAYAGLLQTLAGKSLYPGSPAILSYFSRPHDNVHANELASQMYAELDKANRTFGDIGNTVHLHNRDAFELINAMMPPKPNRGLVLIDPPYEQAIEYQAVAQSLSSALKKWSNGLYMLWYPLLSPTRINRQTKALESNPKAGQSENMLERLKVDVGQHCTGGMLSIEFANQAPSSQVGMYGSGVCLINPPFQIDACLDEVLALLVKHVSLDENALSNTKWHIKPS